MCGGRVEKKKKTTFHFSFRLVFPVSRVLEFYSLSQMTSVYTDSVLDSTHFESWVVCIISSVSSLASLLSIVTFLKFSFLHVS